MDFTPEFVEEIAARRAGLRAELKAILPESRSIVLEIGSGHGHFLARYATEFPEKFCLGVDLRSDRIARAQRKSARARLPNCHFVRAEARELLNALPEKVVLEEIWVLFPDPWPKKRHHKNRLLHAEFFDSIAHGLAEGTRLYFRTDFAQYFDYVAKTVRSLNTWRVDENAIWPLEQETVFQARADGYQSLILVRTAHPATPTKIIAPGLPPLTSPTLSA